MKSILFVDPATPKPYHGNDFKGLGATEGTIVRISEQLAKDGHEVVCAQKDRLVTEIVNNVTYIPLTEALDKNFYLTIVLRSPAKAIELKKANQSSKVWVMLQDLYHPGLVPYTYDMMSHNIGFIVVSEFHKSNIIEGIKGYGAAIPRIRVIYNPVADNLLPANDQHVDHNKLVFFSSPHKGLKQAIEAFEQLHRVDPSMKLYLANPGYYESLNTNHPGIVNLGILTHQEVINHVRDALCVFYPNYVYPETFGVVFSEANAVGTPVITHPIGAAREVLNTPEQLMDCRDTVGLVNRVLKWKVDRPAVELDIKFRISQVIKKWKELLI